MNILRKNWQKNDLDLEATLNADFVLLVAPKNVYIKLSVAT